MSGYDASKAEQAGYGQPPQAGYGQAPQAGYGQPPQPGYGQHGQPPPYQQGTSTSQVPNPAGYNAPPGTYVVNQQPVYNTQQQQVIMTNAGATHYIPVEQKPNYSVAIGLALFSAFCCCPATGIVAIIFAFVGQSSSDPDKLRSYYKVSIGFSIASIVLGVILTIAVIAYVIWFYVTLFG